MRAPERRRHRRHAQGAGERLCKLEFFVELTAFEKRNLDERKEEEEEVI